jgi:hypothetical protein
LGAFYTIFHRLPNARFKFAMAMEAGAMPPDDLKVLRAVQSTGKLEAYKPWFDKMTPKDRILIQQAAKPEWTGIEFHRYFSAGWAGRNRDGGMRQTRRMFPSSCRAWNEEITLPGCIAQARSLLDELERRHGYRGEIVIADNGSTDRSCESASSLGARVANVRDKGYGNALNGGLAAARGRILVMGDADGSV